MVTGNIQKICKVWAFLDVSRQTYRHACSSQYFVQLLVGGG